MRSVAEKSSYPSRQPAFAAKTLTVDMHNHILPALDDGSENMEVAVSLAKGLFKKGFKKVICTPHIMKGFYDNDEENIQKKIQMLKQNLEKERIQLELDYAAEYYLDDHFFLSLETNQKPITLGRSSNFVLLETSFVENFQTLVLAIEKLQNHGYRPVLAHPERYIYLEEENSRFEQLQNIGVLFQVNINSLNGYYSKAAKRKAEYLVERDMVSFLGTNCHNDIQLESLAYAVTSPYYQMALNSSRLLNETLI